MSARPCPPALTLGITPDTRGFGWAAFDGPFSAYDFGMVFVRSNKNERCIRHFERLLDRLEPELVVMEDPSRGFRSGRMRDLHRSLRASTMRREIDLATYSRDDVLRCFETVDARTNQEIAEAVAKQVQGLAHKLPRKRQAWASEDRRLVLFGAAALVITHFHTGNGDVRRRVKDAA